MYHYRYCSTVQTTALGIFFFHFSVCDIQADSSEMFSSLVKNPAPTPPPPSPLMATNKERKSRSASLGVESSFLFFFPSQLAELADGCLHNDKRRVSRWNWFTAPVHTPFTVHFPSLPPVKKCKSNPEAGVSAPRLRT